MTEIKKRQPQLSAKTIRLTESGAKEVTDIDFIAYARNIPLKTLVTDIDFIAYARNIPLKTLQLK